MRKSNGRGESVEEKKRRKESVILKIPFEF